MILDNEAEALGLPLFYFIITVDNIHGVCYSFLYTNTVYVSRGGIPCRATNIQKKRYRKYWMFL